MILGLGCTSVFYFPKVQKHKFFDPAQVNLKEENVEIDTPLDVRVHGWWFKAYNTAEGEKKAKGTIVFFHGNGENLTSHFLNFHWIPPKGYNYLIWDYPGYGVSEGEPSPENNVIAGKAVLHWVHDHKDSGPLIIYGQSLGGNIAMRTVLEEKNNLPFKAFIADSTFRSYRSVARQKAAQSWITWIFQPIAWLVMSDRYAGQDVDQLSPIPLLVIEGLKDRVVPIQNSEQIFEMAKEPKKIWRLENGSHTDVFWIDQRVHQQEFLDYLATLP